MIEFKNREFAAATIAYLRAGIGRRPGAIEVGPFLVGLDEHSANPFRNYAVPEAGSEPSAHDVASLITIFEQHARRPRLEYPSEAAPAVQSTLAAAGFVVEGVLPLLAYSSAVIPALPQDFVFAFATTDAQLAQAAQVQNQAYGEGVTTSTDVQRLRLLVEQGGAVALVCESATSRGVGSGLYAAPQVAMTEIAAVGVVPGFRRRGIAAYLTARLAGEALERAGCRPFLMAASEDEARLYRRVGFTACGTLLHISRPDRL